MTRPSALTLLCTAFALGAIACEPAAPTPPVIDGVIDDVVDVNATFCPRSDEGLVFPTKVILAVDVRGSWAPGSVLDPSGEHLRAVRDLMSALSLRPGVFVTTVGVGSNVYVDPPITPGGPFFAPASQWQEPSFLTLQDVQSDLSAALDVINDIVVTDLLSTDADELARTRYVVVLFGGSFAVPRCCNSADEVIGARTDEATSCEPTESAVPTTTYCEGVAELGFCNDSNFLASFRDGVQETVGGTGQPDFGSGPRIPLQDFVVGGDYNRLGTVVEQTRDLVDAAAAFEVPLVVNTLYFHPESASDATKEQLGISRCRDEAIMQQLAQLGSGTAAVATEPGNLTLLQFDLGNQAGFAVARALVHNVNVSSAGVDSDADGLADANDDSPDDADANDDGYLDSLTGPACPETSIDLVDRQDLDGDGLNGCEEQRLQTDAGDADSNRDGVLDGIAARGNANDSTRVTITERDGCIDFAAEQVPLARTTSGNNRIVLVVSDVPLANPTARRIVRVACVDAAFVSGTQPTTITFDDADLDDLAGEAAQACFAR